MIDPDPGHHRHPSQLSDDDLRRLLRQERIKVMRRMLVLKRQVRAAVTELNESERRLDNITASEGSLGGS